ncbi:MAG: alpha/beta hydrolase-fold protein [Elusimicrobiales bacterium]
MRLFFIFIWLLSALAVQPLLAAQPQSENVLAPRPKPDAFSGLHIYERGDMNTITRFYSPALGGTRTVRVLLPEGYDGSRESYPTVYFPGIRIFSWPGKEPYVPVSGVMAELRARGGAGKALAVGIDPASSGDFAVGASSGGAKAYAEFLSRDLIPYIETNYRALPGAGSRAVAGAFSSGAAALYMASRGGFLNCAALSPKLDAAGLSAVLSGSFPPEVKIWIDASLLEGEYGRGIMSGPVEMAAVEVALLDKLVYGKNLLAYADRSGVYGERGLARRLSRPLRWFFGGEDMRLVSLKPAASSAEAGVKNLMPETVLLSARLSFAGGLEADYIPPTARSSPPYFVRDGGVFRLAHGAEPGPVILSAQYEGQPFSAQVLLKKTVPAESAVSFRLIAPPGLPAGTRVFVSGSLPQFGSWKADAVELSRDSANRRLYRGSVKLPRGAGGTFKFTLGSWARAEKDASGEDTAGRPVLADSERVEISASVDKFGGH